MTDQTEESSPDATQEPQPTGREAQEAGEPTAAGADRADAGAAGEGTDEPVTDRQERRDQRNAIRYRREAKDAAERAERAEARADRLMRREVERLLGEHVADPAAALQLSGTDLADLLDEKGDVDADAVQAFAEQVLTTRPYLKRTPTHHGDIGPRGVARQEHRASWAGLIRPR